MPVTLYERAILVSIHARHCWRANPTNPACRKTLTLRFQSTPAIAGGRTPSIDCPWRPPDRVSIHARHCWRANPPRKIEAYMNDCLFQSTPAIAGGRTLVAASEALRMTLFQSTPAIAGGRTLKLAAPSQYHIRFNPRPPLLAGEPKLLNWIRPDTSKFQSTPAIAGGRTLVFPYAVHDDLLVSIHARHCWRANPGGAKWQGNPIDVSIHARHCWRANPPWEI